jgi:hypothetical protein
MIRTLHADPYVTVTLDDTASVLRYTRSSTAYPAIEALRDCHAKLRAAFGTLPNGKLALLIDVRSAPPRNDAAFETEILEALRLLAAQFPVRATLVKTAVGRLQTQRLARTRDDAAQVFTDEAEALAYLTRR